MVTSENNNCYLFETSWEVCNMVGGIYTVLSTKANTLLNLFKDNYVLIGPDLWEGKSNNLFIDNPEVLKEWSAKAQSEGLKVRTGQWNVPGNPQVILVDFKPYLEIKNELYGKMWEEFQVDSLNSYGDYDESCSFAYASSLVMQSLAKFYSAANASFIGHFHEWTTGMGLLNLKIISPEIATVFTTHATSLGRSIAGNHYPLYDELENYNPDEMSHRLNIAAKHSLEKMAANNADSFTTVSEITARECVHLLGRTPIVTPNGFEPNIIPNEEIYAVHREKSREILLNIAANLVGFSPSENAFLLATSGRYEYKNKGIDLFLDSLKVLSERYLDRETIAFIFVPAWVGSAREDLSERMNANQKHETPLENPFITHYLHNFDQDAITKRVVELGFRNKPEDKVKVIFVPCYLDGKDGILNIPYYDLLPGLDASVFASYYEPWGYTPHESIAFKIPTITTTLAGFGQWAIGAQQEVSEQPIIVVERRDANYGDVVHQITDHIQRLKRMPETEIQTLRGNTKSLIEKTYWKDFIQAYKEAYSLSETNKTVRVNK